MRRTLLIPLFLLATGCSTGSGGSSAGGASAAVARAATAVVNTTTSTASDVVNFLSLKPPKTPAERNADLMAKKRANVAARKAEIQQQTARRTQTSPF